MNNSIQTDNAETSFVHAELNTGLTFARVAATAKYPDKFERNRINARKAYDTALKYMDMDKAQSAELQQKHDELKRALQQLGELL